MDLKQFKYFIAIAEENNLSRAAERLFISQSSLSRYLIKLEDSLNAKLFLRLKNNSLVITKAGKEYLDCCREVVYQIEKCAEKISRDGEHSANRLICGVSGELGIRKLSAILPMYLKKHPDVKVEFRIESTNRLIELLYKNEINLARCVYDRESINLNYIPIYRDRVNLFIPLQHPLASKEVHTISFEDIKDCTFALPSNNSVHRRIIQNYFDENCFTPKKIIEVPTNLSALTFIEEGMAVGLLQEEYENEKVCSLRIMPPLYYDIGFILPEKYHATRDVEDFIQMCLNQNDKSSN